VTPSPDPAITLIALSLLTTGGYLIRVRLRPFKNCRRCHGLGRIPTRNGRGRPKTCRRCKGAGLRPRALRRSGRAARQLVNDARR
jgi:DnaJ-class molecular chaperone